MAVTTDKQQNEIVFPSGRTLLTANTTYYVDPVLGNDGNDGLSAGAGAFLTPQRAADKLQNEIDLAGYDVTVQFADGTYTDPFPASTFFSSGIFRMTAGVFASSSGSTVTLQGNNGDPSLVVFDVENGNQGFHIEGNITDITIDGFTIQKTAGATFLQSSIYLYSHVSAILSNIYFSNHTGNQVQTFGFVYFFGFGWKLVSDGGTEEFGNLVLAEGMSDTAFSGLTVEAGMAADFVSEPFFANNDSRIASLGSITLEAAATLTVSTNNFEAYDGSTIKDGLPMPLGTGVPIGFMDDPSYYSRSGSEDHGLIFNKKVRKKLTANTVFYVNPATGDDANDGLSSPNAKKTPQAMMNDIADNYDINGYWVTIQLEDGTYTDSVVGPFGAGLPMLDIRELTGMPNLWTQLGGEQGYVRIKGNDATPGNVIWQTTNGYGITNYSNHEVWVSGIHFEGISGTSENSWFLNSGRHSNLFVSDCEFEAFNGTGTPTVTVQLEYASVVIFNCEIIGDSGTATIVIAQNAPSTHLQLIGTTTLTDDPVWGSIDGAFELTGNDLVEILGTFSGTAIGKRFSLLGNSSILLGVGVNDLNFIPGTLPGTMSANARYGYSYSLAGGRNVETITANRTLVGNIDCRTQILLNNTSDLDVLLPTTSVEQGEYLVINPAASTFNLLLKQSTTLLATILPGSQGAAVWDGTNWITI